MKYYAGLDVIQQTTSICIVDDEGRIAAERKVTTCSDAGPLKRQANLHDGSTYLPALTSAESSGQDGGAAQTDPTDASTGLGRRPRTPHWSAEPIQRHDEAVTQRRPRREP